MRQRYYCKSVELFLVLMHCTPRCKSRVMRHAEITFWRHCLIISMQWQLWFQHICLSIVDNLSCTCAVYSERFLPYTQVFLCWTRITECTGFRQKMQRCPQAERSRTIFWIRRSKKQLIWCCWAVEWEHTLVTRLSLCWMLMGCIVSSTVSPVILSWGR